MSPSLALPPGRFKDMGAGLEPKKQCGKPFRRDPAATKARSQTKLPYIVDTHPKGRTTEKQYSITPSLHHSHLDGGLIC
jgi:hypothetical protein